MELAARGLVLSLPAVSVRTYFLRTKNDFPEIEDMEKYKEQFIEFMVRSGVLMFGDFTTKSGRKTPFFINTGRYTTGEQMARLGEYYGETIVRRVGEAVDVLFGPAYKGIPLAVTTAVALSSSHSLNVKICFNRKEAKDHGEGGSLVGYRPQDGDRVVIVEDVITAGTSIRETVALLKPLAHVRYTGIIVSVDRMERGTTEKSALQEIGDTMGINVYPIVTLDEVVGYLHGRTVDGVVVLTDEIKGRIDTYREQYGASPPGSVRGPE